MLSVFCALLFLCPLKAGDIPVQIGVQEVSPTEDLMREHGVLNRVLLIYDEFIHRLAHDILFPAQLLNQSAKIIQKFIVNYHEKLEEDYIFTRLEKAETMTDLVKTLRQQHERGRHLTAFLIAHSTEADVQNPQQKRLLATYLHEFISMYRPHAAREDTILFPAFKMIVTQKEYDELGDLF